MTQQTPERRGNGTEGRKPGARRLSLAIWGILTAAVCVLLLLFPPQEHSFWPGCPLYRFTGLYCPFCGGTRALHALFCGEFAASLAWNMMLVPELLMLTSLFILPDGKFSRRMLAIFMVVFVVFGVIRNLPWAPFNLLAPHGL